MATGHKQVKDDDALLDKVRTKQADVAVKATEASARVQTVSKAKKKEAIAKAKVAKDIAKATDAKLNKVMNKVGQLISEMMNKVISESTNHLPMGTYG